MAEQTSGELQGRIEELERQLAQKRSESGADASAPYERAEVHTAVGEQIQQVMPTYQIPALKPTVGGATPSWQDPALAASIQDLVNIAFGSSMKDAIDKAVSSGNAALIDAFHDILTDQLHQELLSRNKVGPAV